jgi:hypothetical protein
VQIAAVAHMDEPVMQELVDAAAGLPVRRAS